MMLISAYDAGLLSPFPKCPYCGKQCVYNMGRFRCFERSCVKRYEKDKQSQEVAR